MALGFASTLAPQAYNPCMRRPAKFTVIGVATDVVSSKFFDHLPSSFSHRLTFPRFRFKRNQFDQFSAEYRLFVSRLLLLSKFIESRQLTFPFPPTLFPFLLSLRFSVSTEIVDFEIPFEARSRASADLGSEPLPTSEETWIVGKFCFSHPPPCATLSSVSRACCREAITGLDVYFEMRICEARSPLQICAVK